MRVVGSFWKAAFKRRFSTDVNVQTDFRLYYFGNCLGVCNREKIKDSPLIKLFCFIVLNAIHHF